MATYFISDFHFNDLNIMNFERLEFYDIKSHNTKIVETYNSIVKEDDTVYILGDLGVDLWEGYDEIDELLAVLNGTKHLILGNHDKTFVHYEKMNIFETISSIPVYLTDRIVLSHEPVQVGDNVINIHGHLHNANLSLPNYLNVSCAMVDYKPVSLQWVEDNMLSKMPDHDYAFLYEWYAPYYAFDKEVIDSGRLNDLFFNKDMSLNVPKSIKRRARLGF